MATIEIADIMKSLRIERSHRRKELKKLDKVISALRGLSTNSTPARSGKRRMSASARRKIAAAQRKRWAKVRAARG